MYDIVLVCGPYKTGTSLITHLLEHKGYFNPATWNNQDEHGNGLSQRYMTKECSFSREINREILYWLKTPNFNDILTPSILKYNYKEIHFNAIKQFISELPLGSVIKDPQFTYTLYFWLEVCRSLNKTVKVYFTDRTKSDLITGWNEAYYTKSLLAKNESSLISMRVMSDMHQDVCSRMNVPFQVFYLTELKALINSNTL